MRVPADASLYRADADRPVLFGSRCGSCGRVSFPPITMGCEVCGALEECIEALDLPAEGAVHSLATVHHHAGSAPTPFGIVEVQLDTGPLIRALLDLASPVAIGDRVEAGWSVTKVDGNGSETVEPIFRAVR